MLRERRHRVLVAAVADTHAVPGPAGLHLRVLLLRLHRPDHVLRARHSHRHAGLPARSDPAAELRHPAPGDADRVRALSPMAPVPLRAGDLAAGRRPRLGARVRHLGWRLGQVDELAPDPDAGQLAAPLPDRDHLVERQRGRAVAGPGHLADGDPGFPAVRRPAVLRLAQPRGGRPRRSSPEARRHEIQAGDVPGRRARGGRGRRRGRQPGPLIAVSPTGSARHPAPRTGHLPGRLRARVAT